jgi:hypothetical protein
MGVHVIVHMGKYWNIVFTVASISAGRISALGWSALCKISAAHSIPCMFVFKLILFSLAKKAVPKLWRLVADFPPRRPGFQPRSGHVGFVVNKVALGQVFSKYLGFPCQFSFHRLLHTHHLSSGPGTIGQLVVDVPSGLSLTPPH